VAVIREMFKLQGKASFFAIFNRVLLKKRSGVLRPSARQFAFPAKLVVFRQRTCPNLRIFIAPRKSLLSACPCEASPFARFEEVNEDRLHSQ
jgi:hypothetical protein